MEEFWGSKSRLLAAFVCCLYVMNFSFCWSLLNDEGFALLRFKERVLVDPGGALSDWNDEFGEENPCSWFGVGCVEGWVVDLNLKNLHLRGTLSPDIGKLVHLKSIVLRNNYFSGVIPEEIVNLKKLELLDLGYNNFSGKLPCGVDRSISIGILLLDNNDFLERTQIKLQMPSCNGLQISRNSAGKDYFTHRKLLQEDPLIIGKVPPFLYNFTSPPPERTVRNVPPPPDFSPSPISPSPDEISPSPNNSPNAQTDPPPSPEERPSSEPRQNANNNNNNRRQKIILYSAIGGSIFLLALIGGVLIYRYGKMTSVKPWGTGLSGQLQRAFVTAGVPKLKRSELVSACEDFSNVIGSSSICTLYKGTLSSGVEIAVSSISVASSKEWSKSLESQFKKKIDSLSKVNHKNFSCLLGYCKEEEPFTRMMVFEYAPNGTLFEHLHIREAEHLDWSTRLRIAMGVAYCLDHMHHLSPALPHKNLTSSSIYLTEDYAGKLSDFMYSDARVPPETEPQNIQTNIYSFGVVLFEMVTGRLPYSVGGDASLVNWASDYLKVQPLREMVDPTLSSYGEDQIEPIASVIKLCSDSDPRKRPSMREVCVMLRDVTGIGPDGAIPKCSPLWWAELEILSSEAS